MQYSTSNILTVADCDKLITFATKDKSLLEAKRIYLLKALDKLTEGVDAIPQSFESVNIEVAALGQAVDQMPEGDLKTNLALYMKRREYQQLSLSTKVDDYTIIALIEKQYDVSKVESEIQASAVYLAALEARKAELGAAEQ